MRSRLIVAAIFIPILLLIFLVLPPLAMPIFIALLSIMAVFELLTATSMVRHWRVLLYSVLLAGLIPFWAYYGSDPTLAIAGLFLYALLIFCEALAAHRYVTFDKLAATGFCSFFIPLFLSGFVRLLVGENGRFYALLPLLIAFISDAGGIFTGMAFGRHKLAPEISPKKSVEGAVGAVLFSVAGCMIYGLILTLFFEQIQVRFGILVLYGVLGSVVSQLGDLSFSLIKRQFKIKDYGHILGGHGGILDRFDSVTFCTPFVELMILLSPAFVTFMPQLSAL